MTIASKNDLVHHYIRLTKQKRQMETDLNKIKKQLTSMQDNVIDYFTIEGIQNLATKDGTAYLHVDVHASLIADETGDFEAAHAALIEADLDYLIKKGVNGQSLSAYVRQQRDNEEPIPAGVIPFIRVHEQPRIGVRS